jgi:uncharacterized protein YbcC (UPF0753/DUF2309 family)
MGSQIVKTNVFGTLLTVALFGYGCTLELRIDTTIIPDEIRASCSTIRERKVKIRVISERLEV